MGPHVQAPLPVMLVLTLCFAAAAYLVFVSSCSTTVFSHSQVRHGLLAVA
jgi:hypothetical protein